MLWHVRWRLHHELTKAGGWPWAFANSHLRELTDILMHLCLSTLWRMTGERWDKKRRNYKENTTGLQMHHPWIPNAEVQEKEALTARARRAWSWRWGRPRACRSRSRTRAETGKRRDSDSSSPAAWRWCWYRGSWMASWSQSPGKTWKRICRSSGIHLLQASCQESEPFWPSPPLSLSRTVLRSKLTCSRT